MEHFGAVFKLELMEETRTQLQEKEAIASFCLILATPMAGARFMTMMKLSVRLQLSGFNAPLNPIPESLSGVTEPLKLPMQSLLERRNAAYAVV